MCWRVYTHGQILINRQEGAHPHTHGLLYLVRFSYLCVQIHCFGFQAGFVTFKLFDALQSVSSPVVHVNVFMCQLI
jgi:hypothetical protein